MRVYAFSKLCSTPAVEFQWLFDLHQDLSSETERHGETETEVPGRGWKVLACYGVCFIVRTSVGLYVSLETGENNNV